jgi:hypothetical protein
MAIDLTKLEKKFIDLFANVTKEEFEQWLLTKTKPMAQQKLYTEEQVKDMFSGVMEEYQIDEFLKENYIPIELPSDEEIEKKFTIGVAPQTSYPHMIEGAKWLKKQILNQNK